MNPENRYSSPSALAAAINVRAKLQADAEAQARVLRDGDATSYVERRVNQLRRDVAFHAVLRRLSVGSEQGRWVVKGGVALQLRLDPSRPSKDIDLTWMGSAIDRAMELNELRRALRLDCGDFFEFDLDAVSENIDETGALVLPVVVRLGGRHFERFTIDLAPSREGIQSEELLSINPPLDIAQLATFTVHVLGIEQQLADKVCAIHETHHGIASSRWRDLADIAMIAQQISGIDAGQLTRELHTQVSLRPSTLPDGLPSRLSLTQDQQKMWEKQWGSAGRVVPISMSDSLQVAQKFVDPLLDGTVTVGRWRHEQWQAT